MGVLTDLVLAPAAEAGAVARELYPTARWPGVAMKGHNSVTLGQLLAILRDADWSPEIFDDELIAQGGDDGPFVTSVPRDFVDEVAGLVDERLDETAEAWAEIEELEGWSADQARALLIAVRELCRRARAERGDLLLWMSL